MLYKNTHQRIVVFLIIFIVALVARYGIYPYLEKTQNPTFLTSEQNIGKEACEGVKPENLILNEHAIAVEIFWSQKEANCLIVTRRPFLDPTSDWAIKYFGIENKKDLNFMEAEYFTLSTYPKYSTLIDKTYSYSDLNEYLTNPKKYTAWEADFLTKVSKFR